MNAQRTLALNFAAQALVVLSKGYHPTETDIKDVAHKLQMIWSHVCQSELGCHLQPLSEISKGFEIKEPNLEMLQCRISDLIACLTGAENRLVTTMNEIAAYLRDFGAFSAKKDLQR